MKNDIRFQDVKVEYGDAGFKKENFLNYIATEIAKQIITDVGCHPDCVPALLPN